MTPTTYEEPDASEALPVERPPDEFVPCPPDLYAAHQTSVLREGDHWRCLICQPLSAAPVALDLPHDDPKINKRRQAMIERDREKLRQWQELDEFDAAVRGEGES